MHKTRRSQRDCTEWNEVYCNLIIIHSLTSAYQQDQTERQQIEAEHAVADQKATISEF